MKILHLCLSCFYIEGFGYQENLLPKFHKKQGHDVVIVASRFSFNKANGSPTFTETGEYVNNDGIRVIRLDYFFPTFLGIAEKLRVYKGTMRSLGKEKPDIIFMHGIQFLDILTVGKFVRRNPNVKLIADTHATYENSASTNLSKNLLHKVLYKTAIKKVLPMISHLYSITPACKKFATDIYQIEPEKIEMLFLGADTSKIDFDNKKTIREKIRKGLGMSDEDIVIITGGKLTEKKRCDLLVNSIKEIPDKNVKLVIFGAFSDDIRPMMLDLISNDSRVKFIGWVEAEDVYDLFLASDVGVFPGTKSALWEQAICSGLPLICRKWSGMEYVDVGGNCLFFSDSSTGKMTELILELVRNSNKRLKMSHIAQTKGWERFSYENIAISSLNHLF